MEYKEEVLIQTTLRKGWGARENFKAHFSLRQRH